MGKRHSTFAMIILIIGVFMSALDNGIIASALSTINYSFQVSEIQGTWGITGYTLGMAISTPIIGKLADKFGRRKLFLIEISIFALGSLLVALSPSFIFFLAARLIQSVGGGGIFIIASSHVLSTYPKDKDKQGGLLGALGAVNGIASVVGPNLGSLILNMTGRWNWLFLINLPIALFVIISGYLVIPETKASSIKTIDFKGLVLLSLGILSFMLAITNLQSNALVGSLLRIQVWGLFGLGIILFIMFIRVEKRVSDQVDPFLPYQLLRSQGFVLTLLMGILSGALIGIFVFIPSFIEQRYGISADNSGIGMSGIGLGSVVGAAVGGSLTSKFGSTKTIVISGSLSTVGFGLIAYLSPNPLWFILSSTIAGIGFGMLMGAPLSVLIAEVASKKDNGVALGTLSVSRQVGITIAPIIYATIIQSGFSSIQMNTSIEQYYRGLQRMTGSNRHQLLRAFYATAQQAYQQMFWLAIIASMVITMIGWYLMKRQHRLLNS